MEKEYSPLISIIRNSYLAHFHFVNILGQADSPEALQVAVEYCLLSFHPESKLVQQLVQLVGFMNVSVKAGWYYTYCMFHDELSAVTNSAFYQTLNKKTIPLHLGYCGREYRPS